MSKQKNIFHDEMTRLFDTLQKNLITYDIMTEQLEQPTSRSLWIESFQKIAQRNHILYEQNGIIAQRLEELSRLNYNKDIKAYHNGLLYSDLESLSKDNLVMLHIRLIAETAFHSQFNKVLPFYIEGILKRYEKDIVGRMPESEIALLCYMGLMECYGQIGMAHDKSAVRNMVRYAHKVLEFEDRYDTLSSDILRLGIIGAFRYLLFMAFIGDDSNAANMAQEIWDRYKKFKDKHVQGYHISDPMLQERLRLALVYIETFVPVAGLIYYKSVTPEAGTWLHQELKTYIDNYTQPDPYTFRLFATSKWIMGEWTATQAYEEASKYYQALNWTNQEHRNTAELSIFIYTVRTILLLLIASDLPVVVKRIRIMQAIEKTLDEIRNCTDKHFSHEFGQAAYDLLTDKGIISYLDTPMRRALIKGVFRYTLLQTYIRSCMISRIGEDILDAIVQYQPELLVGTMGAKNVDDVARLATTMNDYLTEAATMMNIGKLTLIQVARNNYIPLSQREMEIYDEHPRRGTQLLWIDPSLSRYKDIVLFHHKWYDGTNGAPKGDANTRSPYRIFADILNIAHHIEVGKDEPWIVYRCRESFQKTFPKIQREAGTQFNPDIVRLIEQHRDLYTKLCELSENGWKHVYYEIFLDYFGWR